MTRTYKRPSIADSPALQQHREMMENAQNQGIAGLDGQPQPGPSDPVTLLREPALKQNSGIRVFSQANVEPMKNVQTRIPLSVYQKLNNLKYFCGQHTSIGDIVCIAITEYLERAENGQKG